MSIHRLPSPFLSSDTLRLLPQPPFDGGAFSMRRALSVSLRPPRELRSARCKGTPICRECSIRKFKLFPLLNTFFFIGMCEQGISWDLLLLFIKSHCNLHCRSPMAVMVAVKRLQCLHVTAIGTCKLIRSGENVTFSVLLSLPAFSFRQQFRIPKFILY